MAVLDSFQPRHESMAKWTLLVLTLVAAGVTAGFALALPTAATRTQTGATGRGVLGDHRSGGVPGGGPDAAPRRLGRLPVRGGQPDHSA